MGRSWPPPVGTVDLGDLSGTEPVSRGFGGDRGTPVDRLYIEAFLERHAADIGGRVLEIGDDAYTRRFGGARVREAVILDAPEVDNPRAAIRADLSAGENVPRGAFDCIVLTQTLHMIFDVRGALRTVRDALRPGGVLLLTVPGITQIDAADGPEKWFWSMTQTGLRRLLAEMFPADRIETRTYGNVYAATCFLQGLALEEVDRSKLDEPDPLYPVISGGRAVKP